MQFIKVEILSDKDVQDIEEVNEVILLNLSHVVSIKPINLIFKSQVQKGYWIRMSNGKKYRSLNIPTVLKDLID